MIYGVSAERRDLTPGAFSRSTASPAGAAAWRSAGGEESGESDNMVTRTLVVKPLPIGRPKTTAVGLIFGGYQPYYVVCSL